MKKVLYFSELKPHEEVTLNRVPYVFIALGVAEQGGHFVDRKGKERFVPLYELRAGQVTIERE